MVSIDITLLFQVVNFLVSLLILNCLIIRPVREVLARRRANNAALLDDAQAMNTNAAHKLESYEARLLRARADMAIAREGAKHDAEKSAQSHLDGAANDARALRQEASARLRAESDNARHALDARVDEFARQAVGKVLGA